MKSPRTQIIEAVEADLKKIRKGVIIPRQAVGSTVTFNTSPKNVFRALSDVPADKLPALFLTDPSVRYRHLIQDVLAATMRYFVSGAVHINNNGGPDRGAVELLDLMLDDVLAVLTANPTWNGLSRRSRILNVDATTEIEEPSAAFSFELETDFIHMLDVGRDHFALTAKPCDPPYPVTPNFTMAENISASVFNAFLTIPEIAWVEEANIWPVPPEQILRKQCPGVWFQAQREEFHYLASRNTDKRLSMAVMHVVVDADSETFDSSIDRAAANLKNVIGKYADLEGRVLTWDVQSVRTDRSEFPVIFVEAETVLRYMQSFEES